MMTDLYTPLSSVEMLIFTGESLFGEHWQGRMAQELGLSSQRRIRQWLSGELAVPIGVLSDLRRILREQQRLLGQLEAALDKCLGNEDCSNVVSL